jgi:TonB family protein
MGYQALLFCPDEKTTRTVTQVLNELDFEVVPCTEPFAAVKKLMAEHFDAVVVDCDNEQNATLVFKSAKNAANNQSALAVAVVEGQAGVAKAFRIGANLVLTKPINVEQAKGTLRVARGLLRKNEAAKPAGASAAQATASTKPAEPAPASAKPAMPPVAAPRPFTAAPVAANSAPPIQTPQRAASASVSTAMKPHEELASPVAMASQQDALSSSPSAPAASHEGSGSPAQAKAETTVNVKPVAPASARPSFSISSGAASAAAPALEPKQEPKFEPKPELKPELKKDLAISEKPLSASPEVVDAKQAPVKAGDSTEPATSAPTLSFAAQDATEPEGGSRTLLVVVAVILVIAVAAYAMWTQFGHSSGTKTTSAPVTSLPKQTVPAQPVNPGAAAPATSSVTTNAAVGSPVATGPVTDSNVEAQTAGTVTVPPAHTSSSVNTSAAANNTQPRISKNDFSVDTAKPADVSSKEALSKTVAPAQTAVKPLIVRSGSASSNNSGIDSASSAAPSINAVATMASNAPNLMSGANTPAPVLDTVSVSQGVSQGLLIKKTSPTYPTMALRLKIEGPVQLMATISKTGDISAVKILSGDKNLAHAAAEAVKQWKYKPYLLDGAPVDMQTQITVNFKLPR